jgi:(S)-ureidoglycine aminohydrolase
MKTDISTVGTDIASRNRSITKPGLYSILPQANRVMSTLSDFEGVQAQVLATPALGAKFVEHELYIHPNGRSKEPIAEDFENFFYVLSGSTGLEVDGKQHQLTRGGFAWLPPSVAFGVANKGEETCRMLWLRRRYETAKGVAIPAAIIANEQDVEAIPEDTYVEQHLIPYDDELGFDMAINRLHFEPGCYFSYIESHIMEHGLYMEDGRGLYFLNNDFIEVQQDDFIYMAPYCPQSFYATGWELGHYVLYKDVNRDYTAEL